MAGIEVVEITDETVLVIETGGGQEIVVVTENAVEVAEIGVQGPPGSVPSYLHAQISPSAAWTINHNLGFRPDVYLYDLGGNEFDAQPLHVSDNQVIVYLTQTTAGFARCH